MAQPIRLPLPCRLTDDEIHERARDLADLIGKIAEANDRRRLAAAMSRDELKRLREESDQIATEIRTGQVEREVDCEESLDFDGGRVITARLDTGEVIRRRAMTDQDRQLRLVAEGTKRPAGSKL